LVLKKGQNLWEKDFIEGVGTLLPYGNFKPTIVKIRNVPLSSQKNQLTIQIITLGEHASRCGTIPLVSPPLQAD